MQKLKNKTTGEEYIITGAIGVPREIEENTFEVWTHFSVDLDGDGQIDTIEVPPINAEWEVIDVPDPVVEPTPDPVPAPVVPQYTPEQLEEQAFQAAKLEWLTKRSALATMIDDMDRGAKLGISPDELQLQIMNDLATWVNEHMDSRYYF